MHKSSQNLIEKKEKRINKKGGSNFIDTDFIKCYSSNLVKVQKAISNFSGIHSIDQEVVKEFIENHYSNINQWNNKTRTNETNHIDDYLIFPVDAVLKDSSFYSSVFVTVSL